MGYLPEPDSTPYSATRDTPITDAAQPDAVLFDVVEIIVTPEAAYGKPVEQSMTQSIEQLEEQAVEPPAGQSVAQSEDESVDMAGLTFRLDPKTVAENLLWQTAGCCRFVFNWGLQERRDSYKASEGRVRIGYCEQAAELKPMKKQFPWLKVAPSQALQQSLLDLDQAYKGFFSGKGYPNFKRRDDPQSFLFPQGKQIKVKNNRVYLPNIGWVKFFKSREIPAEIRSATVSFDQDHWHISFCCPAPDLQTGHVFAKEEISLDAGVKNHLTDERNNVHMLPTKTKEEKRKLRILARKVSKKKTKKEGGGKNRAKAQAKFRKASRKIINRMKDARHKLTTDLAKNHRQVNVEALRVKNMTASAKGTVEAPGKNVRQKAGLNRSVLEIGFGEMRRQLEYKCKRYGGRCVAVDPRDTSRRCPKCHHTAKGNRISRDTFLCEKCLYMAPADQVGAINIKQKAAGQAVSVCRVPRRHRRFRKKTPPAKGMLTQKPGQTVMLAHPAPAGLLGIPAL